MVIHHSLAGQLAALGLDSSSPPADPAAWNRFLERVAAHYEALDRARHLLAASLDDASEELSATVSELNVRAAAEVSRRQSQFDALFSLLPVATLQEDFTEVGVWLEELRHRGVEHLTTFLDAEPNELVRGAGLVRVVAVNAAAAALLRLDDNASIVGRSPASVRDAASLQSYVPQFEAIWHNRGHVTFEYAGHRADQEPFWGILHWAAPQMGGELDLSRVIVSIIDITGRRLDEERMSRLVRSKDDFLASVSHELRTPLTTVYGSAEALLEEWDGMEPSVRRELVGLIAHESGELTHMVEDLFVAAQADPEAVSVAPEPIELHPLIAQLVSAGVDRVARIRLGEISGVAWADPLRLSQILRNLVSNALRYGGPRIRIEAKVAGGRCVVGVLDDGAGVPDERRETIFDLYERPRTTGGTPGSVGVGLAVSRSLARLMGGDLEYEYAEGWTRFRLELPAAPVTAPRA
jgi:signal transduction histidine kinase